MGGFTDGSGNGLQVGYDDQLANDFVPDLVVRLGGVNRVIETNAPAGSSRYVLLKLEINPAGNDTVSVWNNPSSVDPLGGPDFVWTDVNVSDSLAPFTQSKYQSPGQSGVAYFDEVRLATNFTGIIGAEAGSVGSSIYAASGPPAKVEYYFDVPVAGIYEIYSFESIAGNLTPNAHYVVFDAEGGVQTNVVDQTDNFNLRWAKLGDVLLSPGRQRVFEVSNEGVPAGRFVSADSGMIVLNRRLSRAPELALLPSGDAFNAGQFRFRLNGNVGQVIRVEGSSNLVDWAEADTLTLTNAQALFQDPTLPPEPIRFYRARPVSP